MWLGALKRRRNLSFILNALIVVSTIFSITPISTNTQYNEIEDENHLAQSNWLTGWQYRKSHIIIGSEGAGANYQIRISVHRIAGTDSGDSVYLGTKCRSDFGDIRFTAADGVTKYDHWLESVSGDVATFWIEVQSDLSNTQGIYIYYGNSAVTTASDGQATFLLFDDFSGTNLDRTRWNNPQGIEGTDFSIVDGELRILPSSDRVYIFSKDAFGPGVAYKASVNFADYRASGFLEWDGSIPDFNGDLAIWDDHERVERVDVENDGGNHHTDRVEQMENKWQTHSVQWYSTSHIVMHINEQEMKEFTTGIPDGIPQIPVFLYVYDGDSSPKLYVRWVFVAKLVDTPPIQGEWESEETVTMTTSSSSGPLPPSPWNIQNIWTTISTTITIGSLIIILVFGILIIKNRPSQV